MHSNLRSANEGTPTGALSGAPTGPITAAQRTFPASPIFQPAMFSTGFFVSTDRVDADPTDKG